MKLKAYYIAFFILAGFAAGARTLKTGKNQPYPTIQQAIQASANGDTVWIESGVYKEKNIIVDKSITLLGYQYPVLDGEHQF